jgi:Domain of unknown function (DUF222)
MDPIALAYVEADTLNGDPALDSAGARLEALVEEVPYAAEVDEGLGSLVDGLVEIERMKSKAAGYQVEQVYQLVKYAETHVAVTTSHGMRSWSQAATARRTAVSEVAAALRIPERTAEGLIEDARMLTERLPLTLAGLSAGDFSYRHAKAVVAQARTLPDELHATFETAVVPFASKLTFSKFDLKARTTRERMDPATIKERHEKSLADRETTFEPAPDGMAWLHLYSSASVTLGAWNRADEIARALHALPGETRTLTQLRSDVMADLLLDGTVRGTGGGTDGERPEFSIRPTVTLTVPALAMLGVKDKNGNPELPILDGYGPIDLATATRLAGAAKSWLRVLTHPETGVPLSMGTTRYKVPAPLRAFLRHRDGTCRKPGCNRPAARCDLDHTQEWQNGGQTAHDNLAHLCQQHHDEKHHTNVTVTHQPNGDIRWTMPSGRSYLSEPANRYLGIHELDLDELGLDELGLDVLDLGDVDLRDPNIPDPFQIDDAAEEQNPVPMSELDNPATPPGRAGDG